MSESGLTIALIVAAGSGSRAGGGVPKQYRLWGGKPVLVHLLSLQPFRRLLRDYTIICDSYVAAIRSATPDQIQAIDMGRRGLHNEGAALMKERLDGKIAIDFETARRLFTLVCVLHQRI